MKQKGRTPLSQVAASIAVLAMLCIPGGWATAEGPPRVFLLDAAQLQAARVAIAQRDPAVMPAWTALKADADKALAVDRFSVVDKTTTPPSGDKHDYMSQAPYWWPNPKTTGRPSLYPPRRGA